MRKVENTMLELAEGYGGSTTTARSEVTDPTFWHLTNRNVPVAAAPDQDLKNEHMFFFLQVLTFLCTINAG